MIRLRSTGGLIFYLDFCVGGGRHFSRSCRLNEGYPFGSLFSRKHTHKAINLITWQMQSEMQNPLQMIP